MKPKIKSKTKSKPSYWDQLIAKSKPARSRRARPKQKATPPQTRGQPKANTMAKKTKAQTAEAPEQQDEEFLPPPDPPVNPSFPQDPPAPDEVDHQIKHADPEEEMHVWELDLVTEGTRGEGPRPEEPEAPPPPPPPPGRED